MALKKLTAAACVLGLSLGSLACKPKKGTANPEDYYPLILVALESGKTAAMIGRNEAIEAKNFAGCVSSEVLISAVDASANALVGKLGGSVVIPGINVDLSACMPLAPKEPKGAGEVGVIVEQVVGVALGLGAHYAAKLETTDCKKAKAALGAIAYMQGLVGPIADEIENPDGVFTIPSQTIPLGECSGEPPAEAEEAPAEAPAEEAPAEAPAEEAPAEEAPAEEAPAEEAPAEEAPADVDGDGRPDEPTPDDAGNGG